MTGVENQAFEGQTSASGDRPAILDVPKNGHFKITKSGRVKVPRKLLHCSDGIYEEYSTSEDEEEEEEVKPVIDPKTLTWGPYLWYWTTTAAFKGLAVCDFLGEKLAWFFGITSPRYQYAINEVERMQREEQEEEEQEREEREAELAIVQTAKPAKSAYGTADYESATLSAADIKVEERDE